MDLVVAEDLVAAVVEQAGDTLKGEALMRKITPIQFISYVALFVLMSLCTQTSKASAQDANYGDWTYHYYADDMTDADRSSILTSNVRPINSPWANYSALALKCMDDGLNVILLSLSQYFPEGLLVQYRFDDTPPSRLTEWGSLSNGGAFIPMNEVDSFVESAKNSRIIRMRLTDELDGETVTVEYSLSGFTRALNRLSCYSPPAKGDPNARIG